MGGKQHFSGLSLLSLEPNTALQGVYGQAHLAAEKSET